MKGKYFPHIDTLRAWAVLAVLIYHVRPGLVRSGFLGVDLFFVISGFVVSASVAGFEGNFRSLLGTFYARRFKRILPALLATVLLGVVLSILFIPYMSMSAAIERVASKSLLGMANLELSQISMDYFSPNAELNTFTHTWSLGVEEQFYFLFPFLFFGWLQGGRARIGAVAGLAVLTAASFGYSLWLGPTSTAFYSSLARGWEIGAGVLLFQSWSRAPRPALGLRSSLSYLALAILAIALVLPSLTWVSRLAVILSGAVLLIYVDISSGPLLRSIFENRRLLKIGKWSYSLYLIHWPLVVLMRWTFGLDTVFKQLAVLLLSFALAAGSYLWVETPFRDLTFWSPNWGKKTNAKIILFGIFSVFVVSKTIKVLYILRPHLALTASSRAAADWFPDQLVVETDDCPLTHTQLNEVAWVWERAAHCKSPRPPHPSFFMLGDSHANAYDGLVRKLSHDEGYRAYSITQPGCALLSFGLASAGCQSFFKSSEELILKLAKPGDFVFLPGLRVDRLSDTSTMASSFQAGANPMLTAERTAARRLEQNEGPSRLEPFVLAGLRVILEAPKPLFRYPGFRCADAFNRSNPVCQSGPQMDRGELLTYEAPIFDALESVAERSAPGQVTVWDPFLELCPPNPRNLCEYYRDHRPLFSDEDHLSGYGNLVLFRACPQSRLT